MSDFVVKDLRSIHRGTLVPLVVVSRVIDRIVGHRAKESTIDLILFQICTRIITRVSCAIILVNAPLIQH